MRTHDTTSRTATRASSSSQVTLLLVAPLFTLVWALVTVSFFLTPVRGTELGLGWLAFSLAALVDALLP
jgi:hypothetical protein